jgi:hypothetical protein
MYDNQNLVNRSFALAGCKWLRQHGAEWPAVLQNGSGTQWLDAAVQWARSEGCTAPVVPVAVVVPIAAVPEQAADVAVPPVVAAVAIDAT